MTGDISLTLGVLILGAIVVGLITLTWVASRVIRGVGLIPFEPRRPAPWSGWDVLFVFVILLIIMPEAFAKLADADVLPAVAAAWPRFLLVLLLRSLGLLSGIVLVFFWLQRRVQATGADLGLRFHKIPADVFYGVVGFLTILVPIYGLMGLLNYVFPGQPRHPLIDYLNQYDDVVSYAVCVVAAVLVAPVAEEFFFRGVLQGWLERITSERHLASQAAGESGEKPQQDEGEETSSELVGTARSAKTASHVDWRMVLPITLSSLLFAAVHFSHGVAPIPLLFLALALGYLYQRTHRLLPCIVLHASLNACSMIGLRIGLE